MCRLRIGGCKSNETNKTDSGLTAARFSLEQSPTNDHHFPPDALTLKATMLDLVNFYSGSHLKLELDPHINVLNLE